MATLITPSDYETEYFLGLPSCSVAGSAISASSHEEVSIFRMPRQAYGVYNGGASTITLVLVPIGNLVTNTMVVQVGAGQTFKSVLFNAVVVSGSTGHNSATTYYLTK